MKTNELMLNNWVEYETSTSEFLYGKVKGISEHYVTIDTLTDSVCIEADRVRQIPIDKAILEKNGFIWNPVGFYENDNDLHIDRNLKAWCIYGSRDQYADSKFITVFYTVHELQNILHILGFNNLADNFKL